MDQGWPQTPDISRPTNWEIGMSRSKDGPTEKVYKFMSPCFMIATSLSLTVSFNQGTKDFLVATLFAMLPLLSMTVNLWILPRLLLRWILQRHLSNSQTKIKGQGEVGVTDLTVIFVEIVGEYTKITFILILIQHGRHVVATNQCVVLDKGFSFRWDVATILLLIFWQQTELHSPKLTVRPWK